jgi:hypothetical protein
MKTAAQLWLGIALLLIGLVGPNSALATAAKLELGFFPQGSPAIAPANIAQEPSLLRLEIPYFAEVAAKHYQALLENPKLNEQAKEDLQRCQTQKAASCWIHFGQERGTAFLIGDGSEAWTNCHLVASWIEYRKQELLFAGTKLENLWLELRASSIPLQLTDSQGNLRKSSEESALFSAGVFKGMKDPATIYCSPADDAVKIRFARSLGQGLALSRQKLRDGEILSLGGYPRPTDSRGLGKESDGKNFYWTKGGFLDRVSYDEYFGKNNDLGFILNDSYTSILLADSSQGMSGTAVLNATGEVVGIYKGFLPADREKKDVPRASLFLTVDTLRFIEIYSESLFR